MKLDRSKKYEGLEMVWEFNAPLKQWCGYLGPYLMANANDEMAQKWLEAGHIKPVRETKIVRVENATIEIRANGVCILRGAWPDSYELVKTGAVSLPTVVEFTVEVADEVTR